MTEPTNPEALLSQVEGFEAATELTVAQLRDYVGRESELEGMLQARALGHLAELDFDSCVELLDQIIGLNVTLRDVITRELARQADTLTAEERQDIELYRDAASGYIMLLEGQKYSARADEQRVNGSLDQSERFNTMAMDYYEQLGESELPLAGVGGLRYLLGSASREMLHGMREVRAGNYPNAYHNFDRTRVHYEELLAQVEDSLPEVEQTGQDDLIRNIAELRTELISGLTNVQALQCLVENLRDLQTGNFRSAVESGRESVRLFTTLVDQAMAAGHTRNALMLRRMELCHAESWTALAEAERAIDDQEWELCRRSVKKARSFWNDALRIANRNEIVGVVAQRPESGNMEMLLQSVLRRCDREERYRNDIERLTQRLHHISSIHVTAQGGHAMTTSSRDEFNFNGPVAAGSIGGEHNTGSIHQVQQVTADLTTLTQELATLRSMIVSVARTPAEQTVADAVRNAEDAARQRDEPAVRRYLADAGSWALDFARQLGLTAATAWITASIGA
ncbi:hypothetical protein CS0771_41370 [Catellatospora sp. IY07-71]|uniref:hypothetical protein n=1 Tax=Catellatospora sp. IY07-71 TaxID=2728827 RepID=UPI001BB41FE5|nr:hypothetical protein [Catellatospora sp. IY07-71]BCJ74593.1 hypothetical protein CS0771_41370 [Catellatospora sp. IY07-71]